MPSDVLGTTVFNMKTNDFDFHQGPVFADLCAGGRDKPRSRQDAGSLVRGLWKNGRSRIDGTTHQMGELYTILATQNPVEQGGDL